MLNLKLRKNIKALDLKISQINEEIRESQRDNKYEVKMKKLEDLIELRGKLAKTEEGTKSDALVELDKQIGELTCMVAQLQSDIDYDSKLKTLEELTKVRSQLSEAKSNESHAQHLITGAVGLTAIAMVLNYEKTDIITSKAFSIATKMFRGM